MKIFITMVLCAFLFFNKAQCIEQAHSNEEQQDMRLKQQLLGMWNVWSHLVKIEEAAAESGYTIRDELRQKLKDPAYDWSSPAVVEVLQKYDLISDDGSIKHEHVLKVALSDKFLRAINQQQQ